MANRVIIGQVQDWTGLQTEELVTDVNPSAHGVSIETQADTYI